MNVETEVRCGRCELTVKHRRPPLLATVRGNEILMPVRIGARKARAGGVGRAGMFWRRPDEVDEDVLLRCRRCGMVARVQREALERAARSAVTASEPETLYLSASSLRMAPAAR